MGGDIEGLGGWEWLGGVTSGIQYGGFEYERVDLRVGEWKIERRFSGVRKW